MSNWDLKKTTQLVKGTSGGGGGGGFINPNLPLVPHCLGCWPWPWPIRAAPHVPGTNGTCQTCGSVGKLYPIASIAVATVAFPAHPADDRSAAGWHRNPNPMSSRINSASRTPRLKSGFLEGVFFLMNRRNGSTILLSFSHIWGWFQGVLRQPLNAKVLRSKASICLSRNPNCQSLNLEANLEPAKYRFKCFKGLGAKV